MVKEDSPKPTVTRARPNRANKGMVLLRTQKKQCKAARKALHADGLKGTPEDKHLTKRWFGLVRQHNRLRVALQKQKAGKEAARVQSQFRADPNKFAKSLFEEQKKNCSPTFGDQEAQEYFAETYKDEHRDHFYSPLPGMPRPAAPEFLFSQRCPTKSELTRCTRKKRNGATPGFNGLVCALQEMPSSDKLCPQDCEKDLEVKGNT